MSRSCGRCARWSTPRGRVWGGRGGRAALPPLQGAVPDPPRADHRARRRPGAGAQRGDRRGDPPRLPRSSAWGWSPTSPAGWPADAADAGEAARRGGEPGYLLFVGRLRIRKGVEVLLEALAELRRRFPAARLRIAGDGEHRAALERRAAGAGGGRRRRLPRHAATPPGCAAPRAARRALVVPSIYEGMPLVVLEAMAAGVPVVASAVSGIPEVVVDGETGWLVPPESPAALGRGAGRGARGPRRSGPPRRGRAAPRRGALPSRRLVGGSGAR